MSPQPRVPGWKRVLDAFLAADERTLTNAQLGAIPGVQAFHQRRSDLVRRGFVFTGAVAIEPGYHAYRLVGYRDGTDAVADLAPLPANVTALPEPLVACRDQAAADALGAEQTRRLREDVKAGRVTVRTRPPAPDTVDRAELERLRSRVAELEAERQQARVAQEYPHGDGDATVLGPDVIASTDEPRPDTVISWRGENFTVQTAPHEGALYVVTDGLPGPEKGSAAFVELEDAEGRGHGPDVGVGWSDHPSEGLHRLGPFYAAPQAAADAIAPRRHPRAGRASGPALMRQALEALDRPAHAKAIAAHVLEHGGADVYKGKTPTATMGAQLATSSKEGGEFVRVAPGCFGLREWDAEKLTVEPVRS